MMTIEEKAKAYDIALEKARQKCAYPTTKPFISDLQDLFPELAESEDKKMIQYFKDLAPFDKAEELYEKYGFSHKDAIAWLEKQGEQKDILEDATLDNNEDGLIADTIRCKREKQGEQKPQIKLVFPKFRVGDIIQHVPLEKWDTTKKITHIDETGYSFDLSHQGDIVSGGSIGFSFEKDYELVEQKPVEWSEEDKKLIDDTCHLINTLASGYGEKVTEPITFSGTQMIASIKDRLRALVDNRPQNTWRPSKGQIDAISVAVRNIKNSACYDSELISLYNDLKKLKE